MNKIVSLLFSIAIVFFMRIDSFAAITFVSDYDSDGIAATNPQSNLSVPSVMLGQEKVFFVAVAVQAEGITGAEGTLLLWNAAGSMKYKSTVNEAGYLLFVVGAPYSSEGYSYKVEVSEQSTETREIGSWGMGSGLAIRQKG